MKLMIDAWFFAMRCGNIVFDQHSCLSLKINAHLNMHDSVLFSGFWENLLMWHGSLLCWTLIQNCTFQRCFSIHFSTQKTANTRTRKLWNDLLILSPILCLQVWSWSPFATSMILSIWIWIENVYKEWENRSRCQGLCAKNVLWRCLCFLVFGGKAGTIRLIWQA